MRFTTPLLMLLLVGTTLTSCLKDECTETRTFIRFTPVYKSQAEIDAPIEAMSPRALQQPGIIYHYQNYLLINEFREGIHVFDNSNPENPIPLSFISIDGNEHFAITDGYLQANKYSSLLTIDIADVQNPVEKSRVRNAFSELHEEPNRGYFVYHRQTEETQTLDCSSPNFNSQRWNDDNGNIWFATDVFFANADFAVPEQNRGGGSGTGGSTARFTITHDHLYTVSEYDMKVFDLSNPARPAQVNTVNLGWGIETIYPFKDQLFIGSVSGMSIYDVSTPENPLFRSTFEHVRACDPVVADENTAFVTLRDGTACEGFNNQLDVVDIENLTSPYLIESYSMDNPHGLALLNDYLYVTEGDYGFKVMDVSDRNNVKEVANYKDHRSFDAIALPQGLLLLVGRDGIRQYDLSNPRKPQLLSEIPVQHLD